MQFNKEKYKVSPVGIIPSWKNTRGETTDYTSDLQTIMTKSQRHCTI